jgi:hypothetical protein
MRIQFPIKSELFDLIRRHQLFLKAVGQGRTPFPFNYWCEDKKIILIEFLFDDCVGV